MPIYEYQCKNCNFYLETLQKTTDKPLVECPKCHQPTLHKLISKTSFKLTGTGWYETDFKNKSQKLETKETKDTKVEKPAEKTTDNKSNKESKQATDKSD